MIYALYGSDTYRSRKKLNEIIEAYRQKAGADIDFHRFNAQEHDCANLKGIMATSSLFAQKKLVVVEYAFGDRMESMLTHAKQWQDAKDQHLILCHETLDANDWQDKRKVRIRLRHWQAFDGEFQALAFYR